MSNKRFSPIVLPKQKCSIEFNDHINYPRTLDSSKGIGRVLETKPDTGLHGWVKVHDLGTKQDDWIAVSNIIRDFGNNIIVKKAADEPQKLEAYRGE